MVEVNASLLQKCRYRREVGLLTVNIILAGVVLEGSSRDDQGRVRKDFMLPIWLRVVSHDPIRVQIKTYTVHDFLEMHFHFTVI